MSEGFKPDLRDVAGAEILPVKDEDLRDVTSLEQVKDEDLRDVTPLEPAAPFTKEFDKRMSSAALLARADRVLKKLI